MITLAFLNGVLRTTLIIATEINIGVLKDLRALWLTA